MRAGQMISTECGVVRYIGEMADHPDYVIVEMVNPFSDQETKVTVPLLRTLIKQPAQTTGQTLGRALKTLDRLAGD